MTHNPTLIKRFDDIAERVMGANGTSNLCIDESELDPDFFNLRTGVAGELLQKLVNFRIRVALVIQDPAKYGERFTELDREHRTHPSVRFVRSREEGERWAGS